MFKVGERVFDIKYGWGEVITIDEPSAYPVFVCFKLREVEYKYDGREYEETARTLYHHDYTPVEGAKELTCTEEDINRSLRVKFAGQAMQGLLSSNMLPPYPSKDELGLISRLSVIASQELIKALNEK
jgi:hypothetical protein